MELPKNNTKLYWFGRESVAVFAGDHPDLFTSGWQSITITKREKYVEPYASSAIGSFLVDIVVKKGNDCSEQPQTILKGLTQDG